MLNYLFPPSHSWDQVGRGQMAAVIFHFSFRKRKRKTGDQWGKVLKFISKKFNLGCLPAYQGWQTQEYIRKNSFAKQWLIKFLNPKRKFQQVFLGSRLEVHDLQSRDLFKIFLTSCFKHFYFASYIFFIFKKCDDYKNSTCLLWIT